jgi:hypothetical protein
MTTPACLLPSQDRPGGGGHVNEQPHRLSEPTLTCLNRKRMSDVAAST